MDPFHVIAGATEALDEVERAAAPARRPSGRTDDRGQGGGVQSISARRLSLDKRGHAIRPSEAEATHRPPEFHGDTGATFWSRIIAWARSGRYRTAQPAYRAGLRRTDIGAGPSSTSSG
jgi:hypothetical protein